MNFKHILVPVDSSNFSREALVYAYGLAQSLQGDIVLLNVVEPVVPAVPTYVPPMAGFGQVHKEMMDGARVYLENLKALAPGVPCRCIVRSGEPGATIVEVAKAENIDLIVMATHGRNGVTRLLMGSTTETVIRHAPAPVLSLRAGTLAPSKEMAAIAPPPRL